jgi:hypothetical protein
MKTYTTFKIKSSIVCFIYPNTLYRFKLFRYEAVIIFKKIPYEISYIYFNNINP